MLLTRTSSYVYQQKLPIHICMLILGSLCNPSFPPPFSYIGWMYILEKHDGRLPLRIRAVPEGSLVPFKNGEKVVTDVSCAHVFRASCNAMKTMYKCFYCSLSTSGRKKIPGIIQTLPFSMHLRVSDLTLVLETHFLVGGVIPSSLVTRPNHRGDGGGALKRELFEYLTIIPGIVYKLP